MLYIPPRATDYLQPLDISVIRGIRRDARGDYREDIKTMPEKEKGLDTSIRKLQFRANALLRAIARVDKTDIAPGFIAMITADRCKDICPDIKPPQLPLALGREKRNYMAIQNE